MVDEEYQWDFLRVGLSSHSAMVASATDCALGSSLHCCVTKCEVIDVIKKIEAARQFVDLC